jgi:hypothetical protein
MRLPFCREYADEFFVPGNALTLCFKQSHLDASPQTILTPKGLPDEILVSSIRVIG